LRRWRRRWRKRSGRAPCAQRRTGYTDAARCDADAHAGWRDAIAQTDAHTGRRDAVAHSRCDANAGSYGDPATDADTGRCNAIADTGRHGNARRDADTGRDVDTSGDADTGSHVNAFADAAADPAPDAATDADACRDIISGRSAVCDSQHVWPYRARANLRLVPRHQCADVAVASVVRRFALRLGVGLVERIAASCAGRYARMAQRQSASAGDALLHH